MARVFRSAALAIAVVPAAAFAQARAPAPSAEPASAQTPAREYRVDFASDRVEVDSKLGSLELDGNVRVNVQRYQLVSEHIELTRGPRGVEAVGSSRVAFCACDSAPITLHTTSATLAPPTDAIFSNAVVELGGVPVLWLPRLWLRAPSRAGLTLPGVAYRGEDGLLVGAGGYLPLAVEEGRAATSLYLGAGTYVGRGARVEGELSTAQSNSKLAWDRVGRTAVEVDAHGSWQSHGETLAYRAEGERGPRGRLAPSSLELAARRADRARIGLVHAGDLVLGIGARTDISRASSLDDYGALGPELFLGYAAGLGSHASFELSGAARTSAVGGRALTRLDERSVLGAELRPGPLGVGFKLGNLTSVSVSELNRQESLRSAAEARVGLPLARRFGALDHWVEPLVLARGLLDTVPTSGNVRSARTWLAELGADTALGARATRSAASLGVRGGWLQDPTAGEPALTGRLTADSRWLGASESIAFLGRERSLASFSRLRLGRTDGLVLGFHADGATTGLGARARPLFDETWLEAPRPLLDRVGWSGGALLGVPFGNALSAGVGADYDLTATRLLGTTGLVRYRHACGCLAVAAFVGRRLGRGAADAGIRAVDAWLGLDLMP